MKFVLNIPCRTLRSIRLLFANALVIQFILASCSSDSNKGTGNNANAEAQIRQIEQDWATTAVTGDTIVIKKILADDFLGTSPDGIQYSKQDFLNEMIAHPADFTSNVLNDVKVRFFSEVAVAQGNETFTRKNGEKARFVWTDVLVQRNGRWEIIAAEDLIAPVGDQPSNKVLFIKPQQKELAGIDSCRKEYVTAWMAANADRITHVYTNDAAVLYPNQPAVIGSLAIHAYFEGFFKEYKQVLFQLKSEEVEVHGNIAFDWGKYEWKAIPRGGGQPVNDHGKYLVVLQQQADGSWKVARDMDNSDRPLSQTTRGSN